MKAMMAGGTIRVSRFVKQSTTENNTVLEADANERPIGISTIGSREAPLPSVTTDPPEAAQDGDTVMVHPLNKGRNEDVRLRIGSGGCAANDMLIADADGNGVVAASTGTTVQWVGAIALEAASEGEYAMVEPILYPFRPALA